MVLFSAKNQHYVLPNRIPSLRHLGRNRRRSSDQETSRGQSARVSINIILKYFIRNCRKIMRLSIYCNPNNIFPGMSLNKPFNNLPPLNNNNNNLHNKPPKRQPNSRNSTSRHQFKDTPWIIKAGAVICSSNNLVLIYCIILSC